MKFVQKDEKISRFQPDCRQEDHKGQSNVTFTLCHTHASYKRWKRQGPFVPVQSILQKCQFS